jgi:glycogen synthase
MNILLVTDSFPPACGGSGWSTWELARGLRRRGHRVHVLQPRSGTGRGLRTRTYDGFDVTEAAFPASRLPYLRNYQKNERLYPRLAALIEQIVTRDAIDLFRGQHVLSGPPSIAAARARGVPAVCTVRDYWPVCYWSDLSHDPSAQGLCPGCSGAMMRQCVRPRAGPLWPLALPLIPYMQANLTRKRASLAAADAVIAVSSTIAADLRARAPELGGTRLEVIPNPVDLASLRATAAAQPRTLGAPYALYVGKLAPNKGVQFLAPAVARAGVGWPLVIVGDGPARRPVEDACRGAGIDARFTGWLPRDEVLGWMTHASMLVFPSYGPESLSRVLLEAGALGVATAAMDTGGTRDILEHDVTGLLSATPETLARDIARLAGEDLLRRRLGAAARAHVEQTFDAPRVVGRIEALYREVAEQRASGRRA